MLKYATLMSDDIGNEPNLSSSGSDHVLRMLQKFFQCNAETSVNMLVGILKFLCV